MKKVAHNIFLSISLFYQLCGWKLLVTDDSKENSIRKNILNPTKFRQISRLCWT